MSTPIPTKILISTKHQVCTSDISENLRKYYWHDEHYIDWKFLGDTSLVALYNKTMD